jgi:hypothetical protein
MIWMKVAIEEIRNLINGDPCLKKPFHGPCAGVEKEPCFVDLDEY